MQSGNRTEFIEDEAVNAPIFWKDVTEFKILHLPLDPYVSPFRVLQQSILRLIIQILVRLQQHFAECRNKVLEVFLSEYLDDVASMSQIFGL